MTEDFDQLSAINPNDIRIAAMNLLARREHSRNELTRQLAAKGFAAEAIPAALDALHEGGYPASRLLGRFSARQAGDLTPLKLHSSPQ